MPVINLSEFNRRVTNTQTGMSNFGYTSDNKQGTLYFFKPRQVPDVVVRPYQYSFHTGFINDLADIVDGAVRQTANPLGGNLLAATRMTGMRSANLAIAPAATGEIFTGKYYSDLWTCMLILDNVSFEGRHNPVDLQNRLLYFGFCLDEPVVNSFGNLVFNEGCSIMFTHVTHLDIREVYGRNGRVVSSSPVYDVDIMHPEAVLQCSPERQYMLRPQDLVSDQIYDSEGYEYSTPGTTYIGNKANAERINTALNNPKEQLSSIVTGLARTISAKNTAQDMPLAYGSVELDDNLTWFNAMRNNMADTSLSDRYIGVPVHEPVLLGDILGKYPVLRNKTQLFEFPWNLQEQPMDNSAPSQINIWSSLLMSAVPSVLASYGISDATFRYDSVNQNSISTLDRAPVYEVYELYTFVAEDSQMSIRSKWNQALRYLEENIFPIIIDQVGHFSTMIKYSVSKECAVQLNLIDAYSTINDGIVITNGLYGGLQSPVVGSYNVKVANSREIVGTAEIINSSVTHSAFSPNGGLY